MCHPLTRHPRLTVGWGQPFLAKASVLTDPSSGLMDEYVGGGAGGGGGGLNTANHGRRLPLTMTSTMRLDGHRQCYRRHQLSHRPHAPATPPSPPLPNPRTTTGTAG